MAYIITYLMPCVCSPLVCFDATLTDFYRKVGGNKSTNLFEDIATNQRDLTAADCIKFALDFDISPQLLKKEKVVALHQAAIKSNEHSTPRHGSARAPATDDLKVFKDWLGRCAVESFPDIASQDSQIVAFLDKLQLGDVDDGGWREKMRCVELPSLYPIGPVSFTYFTVTRSDVQCHPLPALLSMNLIPCFVKRLCTNFYTHALRHNQRRAHDATFCAIFPGRTVKGVPHLNDTTQT